MTRWTEDAERELRRYLDSLRTVTEYSGRDPDEAERRAKAMVEDEVSRLGQEDLSAEAMKGVIARTCGKVFGRAEDGAAAPGSGIQKPVPQRQGVKGPGFQYIVFAVILPVISVVTELLTRICADNLFDPLPSVWHTVLFLTIPVFSLIVWFGLRGSDIRHPQALMLISGVAVGVSGLYTLIFLPITPLALIALVGGVGFCALSPLTSFISLLLMLRIFRRKMPDGVRVSPLLIWSGIALSLLCFFGLSYDTARTQLEMRYALSPSEEKSVRYIRMLRENGSMDAMMRACIYHRASVTDFFNLILTVKERQITPEDARMIYYRVTGKKFNFSDLPKTMQGGFLSGRDESEPDEEWDEQSSQNRLKGLDLTESVMDGSLHSSAALGYLEWTMVFHNSRFRDEEARAKIAVPPGGVVSRVTLWVDGEEREAAFGSRSDTKKAYEEVVSRRRDPLLVTTCGDGKVMVRCFPVPRNGDMKIRIGITFPLILRDGKTALLRLPYFAERNFMIQDEMKHSVWIESETPIDGLDPSLKAEKSGKELFGVRGRLNDADLSGYQACISAERDPAVTRCWSPDKISKGFVVQSVEKVKNAQYRHLTLVVDGSLGMKEYVPDICKAVVSLPTGMEIKAVLVSDAQAGSLGRSVPLPGTPYLLADSLGKANYQGGQDNGYVLRGIIEQSAALPQSAIVWVHGPQPMMWSGVEEILQVWRRRAGNPMLYSVQVRSGPSPAVEELSERAEVVEVPRTATLKRDLEELFRSLDGNSTHLEIRREAVKSVQRRTGGVEETSSHLVRLWADDEIEKMMRDSSGRLRAKATELAVKYQLVTPVSGAVVLENMEQYKKAGLQPVNPETVPSVPEPGIWALVAAALAVLVAVCLARKMSARRVR